MPPQKDSVIWPNREGLGKVLGDLELFLMEVIWAWPGSHPLTVKDVHEAVSAERPLAYTSVLSTMGNLVKKGCLQVEKSTFAHRYWPACAREDYEKLVLGQVIGSFVKDFKQPALQHLVGSLEAEDPKLLDALYEELQRRRKDS